MDRSTVKDVTISNAPIFAAFRKLSLATATDANGQFTVKAGELASRLDAFQQSRPNGMHPLPLDVLTVLTERFVRAPFETLLMSGSDYQNLVSCFVSVDLATLLSRDAEPPGPKIMGDFDDGADTDDRWHQYVSNLQTSDVKEAPSVRNDRQRSRSPVRTGTVEKSPSPALEAGTAAPSTRVQEELGALVSRQEAEYADGAPAAVSRIPHQQISTPHVEDPAVAPEDVVASEIGARGAVTASRPHDTPVKAIKPPRSTGPRQQNAVRPRSTLPSQIRKAALDKRTAETASGRKGLTPSEDQGRSVALRVPTAELPLFIKLMVKIRDTSPVFHDVDQFSRFLYFGPQKLERILSGRQETTPDERKKMLVRLEVDHVSNQLATGYAALRDDLRNALTDEVRHLDQPTSATPYEGDASFVDLVNFVRRDSRISFNDAERLLRVVLNRTGTAEQRQQYIDHDVRRRLLAELEADHQGPQIFSGFPRYHRALSALVQPFEVTVASLLRLVVRDSKMTYRRASELLGVNNGAFGDLLNGTSTEKRWLKVQPIIDRLDDDMSGPRHFSAYPRYRGDIASLRQLAPLSDDETFQKLLQRLIRDSEETNKSASAFFERSESGFRHILASDRSLAREDARHFLARLLEDAASDQPRFYAFYHYREALEARACELPTLAVLKVTHPSRSDLWSAKPDNAIVADESQTFSELILTLFAESGVFRDEGYRLLHIDRPKSFEEVKDPESVSQDTRCRILSRLYIDHEEQGVFTAFPRYAERFLRFIEPTKGETWRILRRIIIESLLSQEEAAKILGVNFNELHNFVSDITKCPTTFKIRNVVDALDRDVEAAQPRFIAYHRFQAELKKSLQRTELAPNAPLHQILRAIIQDSEERISASADFFGMPERPLSAILGGAECSPTYAQRMLTALEQDRRATGRFYAYAHHRDVFLREIAVILEPKLSQKVQDMDPPESFNEILAAIALESQIGLERAFALLHVDKPRSPEKMKDPDAVPQDKRWRALAELYRDHEGARVFTAFPKYEQQLLELIPATEGDPRRIVRRIVAESFLAQYEAAALLGLSARVFSLFTTGSAAKSTAFKLSDLIKAFDRDAESDSPHFTGYPVHRRELINSLPVTEPNPNAPLSEVLRAIINDSEEKVEVAAQILGIPLRQLGGLLRGERCSALMAQRLLNGFEADQGGKGRLVAFERHGEPLRARIREIIAGINVENENRRASVREPSLTTAPSRLRDADPLPPNTEPFNEEQDVSPTLSSDREETHTLGQEFGQEPPPVTVAESDTLMKLKTPTPDSDVPPDLAAGPVVPDDLVTEALEPEVDRSDLGVSGIEMSEPVTDRAFEALTSPHASEPRASDDRVSPMPGVEGSSQVPDTALEGRRGFDRGLISDKQGRAEDLLKADLMAASEEIVVAAEGGRAEGRGTLSSRKVTGFSWPHSPATPKKTPARVPQAATPPKKPRQFSDFDEAGPVVKPKPADPFRSAFSSLGDSLPQRRVAPAPRSSPSIPAASAPTLPAPAKASVSETPAKGDRSIEKPSTTAPIAAPDKGMVTAFAQFRARRAALTAKKAGSRLPEVAPKAGRGGAGAPEPDDEEFDPDRPALDEVFTPVPRREP